jgi:hypothetical protein
MGVAYMSMAYYLTVEHSPYPPPPPHTHTQLFFTAVCYIAKYLFYKLVDACTTCIYQLCSALNFSSCEAGINPMHYFPITEQIFSSISECTLKNVQPCGATFRIQPPLAHLTYTYAYRSSIIIIFTLERIMHA